MRIGLLSDSHGELEPLQRALQELGEVNLLLHAGDLYTDALWLGKQTEIEVLGVTGNCDVWSTGPRDRIIEIEGRKLWLVHGHRLGIKHGYDEMIAAARNRGVDLVVFGHTHHPIVFECDDIVFINPGSVTDGRGCERSYGLVEIGGDGISANTFPLVD